MKIHTSLFSIVLITFYGSMVEAGIVYQENFEGATLIAAVSESSSGLTAVNGGFWNTLANSGLGLSNGGKDNFGSTTGRVTEWSGFNLSTHEFWNATSDQERSFPFNFTGSPQNIIAVADSDEFNDTGSSTEIDEFNVFLQTSIIDLTGIDLATLSINFDSSFRYFDDETAVVNIYYNGSTSVAASINIIDSGFNSVFQSLSSTQLGLTGAETSMLIEFAHEKADNDWWWAIDNISVQADAQSIPEPSSLILLSLSLASFGFLKKRGK